ncbi:hypothetical protein R1sor_016890 [Riccia sorocarpa]|uniref:Uncharacterized protein n=1 Tax=Riccia sorocarpa TaxID=122646 RepID=A0ABD3HKF9_9MARC
MSAPVMPKLQDCGRITRKASRGRRRESYANTPPHATPPLVAVEVESSSEEDDRFSFGNETSYAKPLSVALSPSKKNKQPFAKLKTLKQMETSHIDLEKKEIRRKAVQRCRVSPQPVVIPLKHWSKIHQSGELIKSIDLVTLADLGDYDELLNINCIVYIGLSHFQVAFRSGALWEAEHQLFQKVSKMETKGKHGKNGDGESQLTMSLKLFPEVVSDDRRLSIILRVLEDAITLDQVKVECATANTLCTMSGCFYEQVGVDTWEEAKEKLPEYANKRSTNIMICLRKFAYIYLLLSFHASHGCP